MCLLIVNQITLLFASSSGNFDFSTRRRFLNTEYITSLHRFRYTYDEKNLFSIFSRQFSSAQLLLLVFFFNVALFGYFHFAAIYLFISSLFSICSSFFFCLLLRKNHVSLRFSMNSVEFRENLTTFGTLDDRVDKFYTFQLTFTHAI